MNDFLCVYMYWWFYTPNTMYYKKMLRCYTSCFVLARHRFKCMLMYVYAHRTVSDRCLCVWVLKWVRTADSCEHHTFNCLCNTKVTWYCICVIFSSKIYWTVAGIRRQIIWMIRQTVENRKEIVKKSWVAWNRVNF